VLLFCLFLRKTILPDNKLKLFLYNYNQLKFVVIYEIAAVLNLTVMNSGLYIFSYDVWFSENGLSSWGTWFVIMGLGNCLLSIGMLIYAIYQSIQGTELIEYQWRAQMLEEQYERQMRHYKSYQKYTESFRAFKHDYQSMMASLKLLIRENDNEKALELIDDMFNEMQKKVQIHKRYSDSVVLDGMMQDLANICEEKGIRLSSNIAVPRDTKMTMLDMIRIFSNFTNNAVEACQKVPVPDRFIEIISTNRQQWATLQVANCYDGNIHMKNGQFLTTKMEKQNHGLGLLIVKEIAENLGGFVIYETDSENKTFLIRIHIPRTK
jgi:signal transduction histidine kinase